MSVILSLAARLAREEELVHMHDHDALVPSLHTDLMYSSMGVCCADDNDMH